MSEKVVSGLFTTSALETSGSQALSRTSMMDNVS